uniref:Uncharacterized protein n=1 Tax=Theileria annulata TaxID=5874 RepID=A0A3B0N6E8_THEAN
MFWFHIVNQLKGLKSKSPFTNQWTNSNRVIPHYFGKNYYSTHSQERPQTPSYVPHKDYIYENDTYKICGVPIPDGLVQFIVLEKFVPFVTFYDIFTDKSSPHTVLPQNNILESNIFENNKLLSTFRNQLIENMDNDDNKLCEIEKTRLKRFLDISYSHGISWDTLDNLYLDFYTAKQEALKAWEQNKHQLIRFANEVTINRIESSKSLNQMRGSGRLIKLFTQRYYNRWLNLYMSPFSTGMLIKYLKAHVTFALLNRENYEAVGERVSIKFERSEINPYFQKPI